MTAIILTTMILASAMQLDPAEVAERVQSVYEQAESISCDFRQSFRSGTTGKIDEAEGELLLKNPGKMRWNYRVPDRKQYISNGETVYWYMPEERQVVKMKLDDSVQQQTQILFLTGEGNLTRDFQITSADEFEALHEDSYLLKLKPKREESFDYIVLEVNPRDFYVERMIVVEPFGNSTDYRFLNIRKTSLADSVFEFKIPRGVEIIEGESY